MLLGQQVQDADRLVRQLRTHQEAGQPHAAVETDGVVADRLAIDLVGGGVLQLAVAGHEAAVARARPAGVVDQAGHRGRLRQAQSDRVGGLGLAAGRRHDGGDAEALGPGNAHPLPVDGDVEIGAVVGSMAMPWAEGSRVKST